MEVILTEDIAGLGDIGESVRVRPGYARNFLIPRGKAIETRSASAGALEHKRRELEAKKRRLKGVAEEVAEKVRSTVVELTLRVGEHGQVFGSIGTKDIAAQLTALGFVVDRRRVLLDEPIRKVGTHFVKVRLHAEVTAQVKVQVASIEATKEDIEGAVASVREDLETAAAVAEEEAEQEQE